MKGPSLTWVANFAYRTFVVGGLYCNATLQNLRIGRDMLCLKAPFVADSHCRMSL